MAPEQVLATGRSMAAPTSTRSAASAYWLVTGELVFAGRTAMETLMQHVHDRRCPPRSAPNCHSRALDRLILDCLAKNPDDRPASADVRGAAGGDRNEAMWTPERARQWWDVHHPAASAVRELEPAVATRA